MAQEKMAKMGDTVQVYATAKDKFHAEGTAYTVHKVLAEKLVERGKASMTAPKAKAAEKGDK